MFISTYWCLFSDSVSRSEIWSVTNDFAWVHAKSKHFGPSRGVKCGFEKIYFCNQKGENNVWCYLNCRNWDGPPQRSRFARDTLKFQWKTCCAIYEDPHNKLTCKWKSQYLKSTSEEYDLNTMAILGKGFNKVKPAALSLEWIGDSKLLQSKIWKFARQKKKVQPLSKQTYT